MVYFELMSNNNLMGGLNNLAWFLLVLAMANQIFNNSGKDKTITGNLLAIAQIQWNLPYPGGVGPGGARNSESAHN